jgi:hypothetical protein
MHSEQYKEAAHSRRRVACTHSLCALTEEHAATSLQKSVVYIARQCKEVNCGGMVQRLRHKTLTLVTWVRLPVLPILFSPHFCVFLFFCCFESLQAPTTIATAKKRRATNQQAKKKKEKEQPPQAKRIGSTGSRTQVTRVRVLCLNRWTIPPALVPLWCSGVSKAGGCAVGTWWCVVCLRWCCCGAC